MTLDAKKIRAHIESLDRQQQYYFFERITNPKAFDALEDAGAFDAITPPEIVDGQPVHYTWPPTLFFYNVIDKIPDRVAAIISRTDTVNQRVMYDFAGLISKMSPETQATFTGLLAKWLDKPHLDWMTQSYIEIVASLASGNQADAALALAQRTLRIKTVEPEHIEGFWRQRDAVAEMGDDYFGIAIDEMFRAFVGRRKLDFMRLVATLLNDALTIEASRQGERTDYSSIWAQSLEAPPLGNGVKETLVYQLYDNATKMLADHIISVREAVAAIKPFAWPVFARLSYGLLALFGSFDERNRAMKDKGFMSRPEIGRERDALLRCTYPELSVAAQGMVLSRIRRSLRTKKRLRGYLSREVPAHDLEREVDRYRRRELVQRLRPLSDFLHGEALQEYQVLDAEFPQDTADRDDGIKVSLGPEAPRSSTELEVLDTPAFLSYIETWEPTPQRFFSPSREGLARTVEPIFEQRYAEILQHVDQLLGWPVVYVHSAIAGLRKSAAKPAFDSDAFVRLLGYHRDRRRAMADRQVIAGVEGDDDADELWQSLGTLTARSLDDIMRSAKPTKALRLGVWAILTDLLTDPDPTSAYEEENPSDEPWTRALNSVRGSALLSLFEYARWIYRSNGGDQQRPDVAVLAPEAVAMLEEHLRPQVESGSTVRSVYGQNYVSIYAMSKSWTVPATSRIFGPPIVAADAAWMTYLALNNVYDEIFNLLRLRYYETVVNLRIADYNEAVSRGLAAHVIRAYARGLTAFDEPDSIIGSFADYASPALLGNAIYAAGNSLQATDVTRDIWDRMEQLYDRLLGERAQLSSKDAFEAFGSFGLWVIAPTANAVWVLDALQRTFELTHGQLNFRARVLAWLADLSVSNPYGAAGALLAMTAEGGPLRYSLDPSFRAILKNAIRAGGEAFKVAAAVDERLTRIGIHSYHDLFRLESSS